MKIEQSNLSFDMPELVRLFSEFVSMIGRADEFDPDWGDEFLSGLQMNDNGVTLVARNDDGTLSGAIIMVRGPVPWNYNVTQAQEIAWWVDAPSRRQGVGKALLLAAEQWARQKNARWFVMSALSINATVGAALSDSGFERFETSYIKRLGA